VLFWGVGNTAFAYMSCGAIDNQHHTLDLVTGRGYALGHCFVHGERAQSYYNIDSSIDVRRNA
jgi:hypothetical protein